MFGLLAAEPVGVAELLRDAPRSLCKLATEHGDGWGVALMDLEWSIYRSTSSAATCAHYDEIVSALRARMLVAHIRKKTVGETSIKNTHPFRRGNFVFAHNGTVKTDALVARSSQARLAEIEGATDSEKLFAFVLTHVDEAGDVARGVTAAVRELHAIAELGAATFLLSCGARIYAHRLGRTLFTHARTDATLVASEPLGPDWTEVPERTVVVLEPPQRLSVAA